jgi:hypothetical protein
MTRTLVLAALLGLATAGGVARADDAEEARFHDGLARQHYEAGRYEQTIREFFFEQRLASNPRVGFNIALCFDQLHRDDDAYLFFREYLASDDDDASRRSLAQQAIARLEPRVARVAVASEPAGATVYVDQRDHGSYGVAPRVIVVAPGAHTLVFELEGHRTASVEVQAVRGSEVAAQATLARIVGTLEVASSAPGTASVLDAAGATVASGATPLEVELPPGDYRIDLAADGHRPWQGLARVVAGERARTLAEPSPLDAPTADLTVTASAAGALIELDGEGAGFAPTVLSSIPIGAHRVRVSHPGLQPWQDEIELSADARSWLTVTLVPPSETIRSPLTWVFGGVGVAGILAGGIFGGLAIANHDRFGDLERRQALHASGMGPAPAGSLSELRDQGMLLSTTTDVLFAVGAAALATAIVLFFATETTEARRSEGTFTEGER